LKLNPSGASLT